MSDVTTDLKDQFLTEGRALVEAASECLLRLEKDPDDRALVAELFRAVHTLKGNSGLFPVAPLTRVVHAAEDLLDAVRAGKLDLDSEMADVLLDALDQVSLWMDAFERLDRLPDQADDTAATIAAHLARFNPTARITEAEPDTTPVLAPDWLDGLDQTEAQAAQSLLQQGGVVALDYRPDAACFFRGEDPLLFMLTLPGRAWLTVTQMQPLIPGPDFDPYQSVLRFRAITTAPLAEVQTHLAYVAGQVAMAAFAETVAPADPVLLDLLTNTQTALTCDGPPDLLPGRIASTITALSALLPPAGLAKQAEITAAGNAALAANTTAALLDLIQRAMATFTTPKASPAPPPDTPPPAAKAKRPTVLKVDQARIDMLMKLAGELIVAKNGLPFLAHRAEQVYGSRAMAREIKAQFDVFNRIIDELQSAVMQVRMVPLGSVFERFRRSVRDLARQVDKPIQFQIEGEEVEADKNIVEDLSEPLIHLIRNAVDHGLETQEERLATGKPAEGLVRLAARLAEDKVVIEVSDDGRGIDVARVRAKAVERGLLTADEAAALPEEAALRLILRPGFSTAETISALSGRGVGMDVVATMVERSGGWLTLNSQQGRGTTVSITLPLSMTVRRMMMVDLADGQYGVPLEMVRETIRVPRTDVHVHLGHQQIVRRDRLVPLCDLRKPLGLTVDATQKAELSVLVVSTGQGEVGLIVDAFRAGTDVIPHPLAGPLAGLRCLSGAALLGDGSILMILNVEEVLQCPW